MGKEELQCSNMKEKQILRGEMTWRKFPDDKPEKGESVIVYGKPTCGTHQPEFIVIEARYKARREGFEFGEYDCDIEVTHWMPLPPPPKD